MATTALSASVPQGADGASHRLTDDAAPPHAADTSMRCPDPSAHCTKNSALQNQASAAALYSTKHPAPSINPLGPDGNLSSASAATSLKYAKASDLPSFPVVGIDTQSSAGVAALLANQNKKSPEWWKPEQSSAAGKAALLANGYKMASLWQPEASAAGSKAALLAHRDGPKLNLWQPQASSEGHSAATIAMRQKGLGPGPVDYGFTDDGRKNAFTAATGAHASSHRKRAQSVPQPAEIYPDSRNSAKNALSAATLAHSPSMKAKPDTPTINSNRLGHGAMEAARIQHAKSISRDMYTSTPPVGIETEEKKRNDALRASAISMAKKMYDPQQQRHSAESTARSGATVAHGQLPAAGEEDIKTQALRYIGIQEAAQKLAQERLAKIGYDENAAYRSHYGYEKPRSRFSIRGRGRANSETKAPPPDASDSDEDDFRSRRIRSQMDQFNKQLADVDAQKRDNDRKSLLAAAERKVHAQLQGMDQKIFDKTGKMSPAMVDQWDEKARQRALANSEARLENHGRVHIGNGKYMDQTDIDAIAQARIQPTLDEITERTEKRRAEDEKRREEEEERRLDLEEKKRRERTEKERAAEIKAEEKHSRDEEKRVAKLRTAEEKASAKQEKEAEKAKDESRKSKEVTAAPLMSANITPATAVDNDDLYRDPSLPNQTREVDATSPTSPNSSKGLKSIFSKLKRRSKHTSAGTINSADIGKDKEETGFVGGASLRSSTSHTQSQQMATEAAAMTAVSDDDRPHNLGDVEPSFVPHVDKLNDSRSDVSSLSDYEDPVMIRGRSTERVDRSDSAKSGAPEFEEAQDHFDEGLAPPPTFTTDADKAKGSPNRDSKFHEVGI
ncbi:Eisosome assembly protein [Pleosporales sp. CAS-2024a]